MEHIIQPLNDRVLVRRLDTQASSILWTPQEKGLRGEVLAIGPGKWIPGEWWYTSKKMQSFHPAIKSVYLHNWEWIPGHRQEMSLKPGMKVLFNSKWNDFASSDYHQKLPLEHDERLHLIQEADIIGIIPETIYLSGAPIIAGRPVEWEHCQNERHNG